MTRRRRGQELLAAYCGRVSEQPGTSAALKIRTERIRLYDKLHPKQAGDA